MPLFKTPFNGYSVKFSPFYESRIAVGTSQNFGILGNGRVHILDLTPGGAITQITSFDTADGVYDIAWSESHDNLLIAAVADGSLKLYDLSLPPQSNPVRSLSEHTREVHSVDYNPVRRDSFISSSWDDTIKLWTVDRPVSVRTFKEHSYCVYSSSWNPRHADVFASASGDCTVKTCGKTLSTHCGKVKPSYTRFSMYLDVKICREMLRDGVRRDLAYRICSISYRITN